ncbi:hydroxymethylglutaryl-CoA lyase [Stutzerimonas stutzeri]|uniref:Hydroxymethylglutaryl-CoA lyase n=1 Tax=Stutzerimonas stutzeri TaxID=316 RepID=W8RVM2_STUST|nr:hydroxymethylglutaryl-CoA lyase [Stutzerimonas stutzeri]AHL76121.1 hydroxymethylglutaryl-CoA lyase [Stutzerimonas stutzeri]MCQ4330526.1 hydroxymethylglutaryl-CoA lyase [Stutzerimonas stutzeri]
MTKRLYIQDVATRDGFQIEPNFIPTEDKITLIDSLSDTGLAKIEVTSFTSPKAIPNLRDAEEVMRGIRRVAGVEYTVLVPNVKGCERALSCDVDEINLVMSASDTHGLANLRMTPEQSLVQFREIIEVTRGSDVFINASLSTTFGCPFEGEIPEPRVYELVQRLLDIGVQGVTLCDTTGMADPAQVERICRHAVTQWPEAVFTAHFHNTRGMGLANALAALNAGIDRFDASLGGLGGCPYAPGASGNICTEDLVHMFQRMGLDTGVDLDKLLQCAASLPELVGHEVPGAVLKAGKADRQYPKPKWMEQEAAR